MTAYHAPCEMVDGVLIPGCWEAVIYGDDACTCPGSPNAIAMERRSKAWERLERIREKRRLIERAEQEKIRVDALTAAGIAAFPNAVPTTREGPPATSRYLRVIVRDGTVA